MTTSTLANPETTLKASYFTWYGSQHDTTKAKAFHDNIKGRVEDAVNLLASLNDADAVAEFLRHEGVTGRIGISTECPVAVWLTGEIGVQVRVAATISIPWEGATTVIDAPKAVAAFYRSFDGGAYAFLQRPDRYGRVLRPITA